MKLTDRIKDRFLKYKEDTGQSINQIHHELIKDNFDITYEGLRHFITSDNDGSGNTINMVHEFLTERGY